MFNSLNKFKLYSLTTLLAFQSYYALAVTPDDKGLINEQFNEVATYNEISGDCENLPTVLADIEFDNPARTTTTDNFSLADQLAQPSLVGGCSNTFASRFSGEIHIGIAGPYTFYLDSDDGSQLRINGSLVVDNDGVHEQKIKSASKNLTAGWHYIEVVYFHNGGIDDAIENASLVVSYINFGTPGDDAVEIPKEAFRLGGAVDSDNDGQKDYYDSDDDNDGVLDVDDAFPFDVSESIDTDGDGTGNNADLDDDNDGYSDLDETANGTSTTDENDSPNNDADNDFVSDILDIDDDNDNLIEISSLADLNEIRNNLGGTSLFGSTEGCLTTCNGFELTTDLDFDTSADGVIDENDDYWNNGDGWLPIGDSSSRFIANFEGNHFQIKYLMVNRPDLTYVGLFGYAGSTNKYIQNIQLTSANVVGGDAVGGIIGSLFQGSISNISVHGNVEGTSSVGGVVGNISRYVDTAEALYHVGDVTGTIRIGGIAGYATAPLSRAYHIGIVEGGAYTGGVVGLGANSINDVFSAGSVTGDASVGGVIGELAGGELNRSFTTTTVTGNSAVGAIIGLVNDSSSVSSNYYVTNDALNGFGSPGITDTTVELTYAQIQCPLTAGDDTCSPIIYSDWDDATPVWDFGTNKQAPGLMLNNVAHRIGDYDYDLDGINNDVDTDDDNDGVEDGSDAFPFDAAESVDTDLDGVGNNADVDDDNDSLIEIYTLDNLREVKQNLTGNALYGSSLGCASSCNGFELMNDLSFDSSADGILDENDFAWNNGEGWWPIGYGSNQFLATFEGNGNTIHYLMINRPLNNHMGLFGHTGVGANIRNLTLAKVNITANAYVGGVIGYASNLELFNVSVQGFVNGSEYVGGVIGYAQVPLETASHIGNVTGVDYIGGVVGYTSDTISQSFHIGHVQGTNYVGGIVGLTGNNISDVYSVGSVSGQDNVGGIAGKIDSKALMSSYSIADVKGNTNVGALVGRIDGSPHFSSNYYLTNINLSGIGSADITDTSIELTKTEIKCSKYAGDRDCPAVIYSTWNEEVFAWHFGTSIQYPSLIINAQNYYIDDFDNDGVLDEYDAYPTIAITGYSDPDADGKPLECDDLCLALGMVADLDHDNDGQNDDIDNDDDGDGVEDSSDAFPLDSTETVDTDNDGTGNNTDTDDDNDGYSDSDEIANSTSSTDENDFPLNDTDNDFVSDISDIDDDNDNLIEISSLAELDEIRNNLNGTSLFSSTTGCLSICNGFELTADLDFDTTGDSIVDENDEYWNSSDGWQPIGNSSAKFTAIFEGNNHQIKRLTISRASTTGVGLFGYTDIGATIQNLILKQVNIEGDYNVGGLLGAATDVVISNVGVEGKVEGDKLTGGIVGSGSGDITMSYHVGNIKGADKRIGGIIGFASAMNINHAYHIGKVEGDSNVGGIAGLFSGIAKNVYAAGQVIGKDVTGGIIGFLNNSQLTQAYTTTTVTAQAIVGAIAGHVSGDSSIVSSVFYQSNNNVTGFGIFDIADNTVKLTQAQLQCPQKSNDERCSPVIFSDWDDVTPIWHFGTSAQYPALMFTDVAHRIDDFDNDGVLDNDDAYPSVSILGYADPDGDGIPLQCDAICLALGMVADLEHENDDDNDGYSNDDEIANGTAILNPDDFPQDDADNDFVSDLTDLDDDNDGYSDVDEIANGTSTVDSDDFPVDTDGDFVSDLTDIDDDNDNLIEISSINDLNEIRNSLNGTSLYGSSTGCLSNCDGFELTADLNFDTNGNGFIDENDDYWNEGAGWVPIGNPLSEFESSFEGNNYKIQHLMINHAYPEAVGLFGYVDTEGYIRNIHLTEINVKSGNYTAGLIASTVKLTLSNVSVQGNVEGVNYVGGVIGFANAETTIEAVSYLGNVKGEYSVGGLLGTSSASITRSYHVGNVVGDFNVGGVVGTSSGNMTRSYHIGNVEGGYDVGGIVGWTDTTVLDISDVYSAGRVIGQDNVGGIVGELYVNDELLKNEPGKKSGVEQGVWDDLGLEVPLELEPEEVEPVEDNLTNRVIRTYSTAFVSGTTNVGALFGLIDGTPNISENYFLAHNSLTGIGSANITDNTVELSQSQLQCPVSAGDDTCLPIIFSHWDDSTPIWDFGTNLQYPGLMLDNVAHRVDDFDNDGVLDNDDAYPSISIIGYVDGDADGAPSICDDTCLLLGMDEDVDADGDGIINEIDNDDDNDGVLDNEDAYPSISIIGYVDGDADGAPSICDDTCLLLGMNEDIDDDNDNLIEISSLNDLNEIRNDPTGNSLYGFSAGCLSSCNGFELTNDLDFDTSGNGIVDENDDYWNGGEGWLPIIKPANGRERSVNLSAHFEGNHYTIKNLMINRPEENNVGLFYGLSEDAYIHQLSIAGANILGGDYVGILSGEIEEGVISYVNVSGIVKGLYSVGGIIGASYSSTLSFVYHVGNVEGEEQVGGVSGLLEESEFNQIYHIGAVIGTEFVGGLIGQHYVSSAQNVFSAGTVTGNTNVGGILGELFDAQLKNAYTTATVNGDDKIGALIGLIEEESSVVSSVFYLANNNLSGFGYSKIIDNSIELTQSQLQCPQSAGDETCSPVSFGDWDDITPVWDFGTDSQYPGLLFDNVAHRIGDFDNDGVLDNDDVYPSISISGYDDFDGDGAPDECDAMCPIKGMVADNDDDNDGYSDNDELANGTSTLDAGDAPLDADNDYLSDLIDIDDDNDNLIEISSLTDLYEIRNDPNGTSLFGLTEGCLSSCNGFELTSDLDFDTSGDGIVDENDDYWNDGAGWEPIGSYPDNLAAVFEGNNYQIQRLMINRPEENSVGLFGSLSGSAEVRNLDITGAKVIGGDYVGILTGSSAACTVTDVHILGTVKGKRLVGGFIGESDGADLFKSYFVGNAEGETYVGGLVGVSESGELTEVYHIGHVSGVDKVGGLTGVLVGGTVHDAFSAGSVNGSDKVGGIAGSVFSADLYNLYTTSGVTGDSDVGALIGIAASGSALSSYYLANNNLSGIGTSGIDDSTTELTQTQLQCPQSAGDDTCSPSIFGDWDDATPIWDFGTSTEYPGLILNSVTHSVNDFDNDGILDNDDAYPAVSIGGYLDGDGDGLPAICDEACIASGMVADIDVDNDGINNDDDSDDDNDGIEDDSDAFPLDETETIDTDSDGIGNNADTDDDNDGVLDENDAEPLNDNVYDITAPVVTVADDISVAASDANGTDASVSAISIFLSSANASDNFDGAVAVSHDAPNTFSLGETTVTFSATDAAGNSNTATATVTVADQTAPTIILNGNTSMILVLGDDYSEPGAMASDNVDGDITGNIVMGGVVDTSTLGLYTLTYNVSDAAGNAANALTRQVSVQDALAPVVIAPNNIVVAAVDANGVLASDNAISTFLASANASDDVEDKVVVFNDALDVFPMGVTAVTFSATDSSNNTGTAVATITVVDQAAPVITLIGNTSEILVLGDAYAEQGATAEDNVDGDISADISIKGDVDTSTVGVYSLSYSAVDTAGNAADIVTRQITVQDASAPVVIAPNNIVVAALDANGTLATVDVIANFLASANASDDVDGSVAVVNDAVDTFTIGVTTVTFSATDDAGNTGTAVATVTVSDDDAPVITLSGNTSMILVLNEGYTEPGSTAEDNVDGDISIDISVSGVVDTSKVGIYTLTYSVSDSAGNEADVLTRQITVQDASAPVVIAPNNIVVAAVDANGALATDNTIATFLASANASDDVDDTVEVTHDGADIFAIGVTTVTFSSTDSSGNIGTAVATITVADEEAPVLSLSGNTSMTLVLGEDYDEQGATAEDNVDGDISNDVVISGTVDTSTVGVYTLTYNVSDAAGNEADEVTRQVTVQDASAPVVVAPNNTVVAAVDASGVLSSDDAIERFLASATASDDVDGSVAVVSDAVDTFPIGVTTVTFSATDEAGNTGTAVATVTVSDEEAPVITLSGNTSMTLVLNETYTEPGSSASDNVDGDISANINISGVVDTSTVGIYTLTYRVSDAAGNAADALTRQVTVQDASAPVVTVPDNIVVAAVDANGVLASDDAIATFLSSASASDDVDGSVAVVDDAPDTFAFGVTTVTFFATDSAGNTGTATATVTVTDDEAPVITLDGDSVMSLAQGYSYNESDAMADDNVDGDISAAITIGGVVDTSTVGIYTITYNVSDNAGNAADEVTREVEVLSLLVADSDNDGVVDAYDAFPEDSSETIDTDLDGTGNNADTDDDNDGVEDGSDAFPLDVSESKDSDGDGIGDKRDDTPYYLAGRLNFSLSDYMVAENDSAITLTVLREDGDYGELSVDYAMQDGSATATADYSSDAGTLTFVDGETSKTIIVTIVDDATYEGVESFTVTLSNLVVNADGEGELGAVVTTTVAIEEDDAMPPAGDIGFEFDNELVTEDSSSITLSVIRDGGSYGEISLSYVTTDDSAKAGSDYITAAGTLTFADGEISKTITVDLLDNDTYESDETFTVQLSALVGEGALGTSTSIITISDDEAVPDSGVLSLAAASYLVDEDAGTLSIDVVREGGDFGEVSVDVTTTANTAMSGEDFEAITQTLVFAGGEVNKTITLSITDDASYEGDETFTLSLNNVVGTVLGSQSQVTVTITEDDAVPSSGVLQFSGTTYSVAEDDRAIDVTITRSGGHYGEVSVEVATVNGTATAGDDYAGLSQTITFADGEVSKVVTVTILDDAVYTANQTFSIKLLNLVGDAVLGVRALAQVTIVDDEGIPAGGIIELSGDSYSVAENAGDITITLVRIGGSYGVASVEVSTQDTSAVSGSDYIAIMQTVTFMDGEVSKTVSVDIIDNDTYAEDKTFSMGLSNVMGYGNLGAKVSAVVSIVEDDSAPTGDPTVTPAQAPRSSGGSLGFIVLSLFCLSLARNSYAYGSK